MKEECPFGEKTNIQFLHLSLSYKCMIPRILYELFVMALRGPKGGEGYPRACKKSSYVFFCIPIDASIAYITCSQH